MIPRSADGSERERVEVEVEIEGRRLRLSNLDKLLWPRVGFTKGAMIDYYAAVGPALVPHIAGRPLTLARFPDGVEGRGWYQSNCRGRPEWLQTRTIIGKAGQRLELCVVNDLPSLMWVANFGAVEIHPFLASGERQDEPAVVVFDLDPGPPAGFLECCSVALSLRGVLDGLGLASFPKTSGSLGLHVYVPLNTPHSFTDTKEFARAVAAQLATRHAERVVDVQRRSLRPGKVLIDWLQNDPTRSTVAPYSLRATSPPSVSTPVTWDEIEGAVGGRDPSGGSRGAASVERLRFGPAEVLDRVERLGDLFRPVLELRQVLPP